MLIGVQCAKKAKHTDGLGKKSSISKQGIIALRCLSAWFHSTIQSVGMFGKSAAAELLKSALHHVTLLFKIFTELKNGRGCTENAGIRNL